MAAETTDEGHTAHTRSAEAKGLPGVMPRPIIEVSGTACVRFDSKI